MGMGQRLYSAGKTLVCEFKKFFHFLQLSIPVDHNSLKADMVKLVDAAAKILTYVLRQLLSTPASYFLKFSNCHVFCNKKSPKELEIKLNLW